MHFTYLCVFFILFDVSVIQSLADLNCSDVNIQQLCLYQDSCNECLQADSCCNWCYDQNYSGRKCDVIENLGDCKRTNIEINSESGYEVIKATLRDFTDGDVKDVVQIKPQFINLKLAKGVPVNISFTYKPAKNYPLDLYYLGDLSVSMREHLSIFKTLGTDLPNNLTQLTKNFKLAYGSFLDKVGMPFYFTAPESIDNPCLSLLLDDCEKGYLFKHRLNFTKDTATFAEKVSSSKITANVDDLDGALDAILQILVCGKKMEWSEYSRKLILLPTDSLLHSAGDGLLVGAVLNPDSLCLIDDQGNHTDPLKYDYPSVGQIADLLKEKKVNIIFAVKDAVKLAYYKNLTAEVLRDSAFVGELEEDSKNILQLISKGFYNFARRVSFSINTTESENVDVQFFSDCDNVGFYERKPSCYNVEEEEVNFLVQLTLMETPTKKQETLYIEEQNINERISLDVTYLGLCECSNYAGTQLDCQNGVFRCGECDCEDGWTGQLCDEECDNSVDYNACRSNDNGIISSICHRNGNCICGRCHCDFPFEGKYCQNSCPVKNGQKCSGPLQGTCVDGQCICKDGYGKDDCSCSLSTNNCKFFGAADMCNGNGVCVCNECKCNVDFSGRYCELYKKNNTLCEDYRAFAEDAITNGTKKDTRNNVTVLMEEVDEQKLTEICNDSACTTLAFTGNSRCTIKFCFYPGKDETIHVPLSKNCYMTAGLAVITTAASIFFAILVGGLLAIAIAKLRIYRLEQAEYRKFEDERKNLNELNPIYKDPVTFYRNPMNTSRN